MERKQFFESHILITFLFVCLIFLPILLMITKQTHLTRLDFDIPLAGYFESHEKIDFSKEKYAGRDFQRKYEDWFNSNITLRIYYIRLYNQIQYTFFKLSNRIIGKNNDIFEMAYINAECGLEPRYDFSIRENYEKLQNYANNLKNIQKKLAELDKFFIFYISPSKASVDFDNIPYKYRIKRKENFKSPYFYLKDILCLNNINYIDSRDFLSVDGIPDFYTTGIHWARPIEQRVSKAIVEKMSELSGKETPKMVLKELKKTNTPYWRETDVFDLTNIIAKARGEYYEYETDFTVSQETFYPRILTQGGSFADGFYFKEYAKFYKDSYSIFYNTDFRIGDGINKQKQIFSWEDVDFTEILDNVDFVIVEMNEAVIPNFSNGFVEYLDNFLDSYTPKTEQNEVK